MAVEVRITNPNWGGDPVVRCVGDEPFEFGRDVVGAGRFDGRTVSRRHGAITATDDGFAVTTLGSKLGVVIADLTTPSVLTVPMGVGPVQLPFPEARLTVDQRRLDRCLIIEVVGSPACDRWRQQWGPEVREGWGRQRGLTSPPWEHLRWTFRNGNPHAWFRTLVAMCEPRLEGEARKIPTNAQLAHRLYLSVGVVEKHVTAIHQNLDVEPGPGSREELVALALLHGLVIPGDPEWVLAEFPKQRAR